MKQDYIPNCNGSVIIFANSRCMDINRLTRGTMVTVTFSRAIVTELRAFLFRRLPCPFAPLRRCRTRVRAGVLKVGRPSNTGSRMLLCGGSLQLNQCSRRGLMNCHPGSSSRSPSNSFSRSFASCSVIRTARCSTIYSGRRPARCVLT